MHLHTIDIVIICSFLLLSVLVGTWVSKRASRDTHSYFLGGNVMPWYVLGVSDASGHVRHRRHDVARVHPVRLRAEERLDPVGVAGVQPGLPHGVPLGLAAPLERHDRGGLDRDPVRQGQGGPALPPHRRDLRPGERGGLPVLRLQGHRQVRDGVPALAALRQPVRAHPDGDHRLLRGQGRDVQRRDHRGDPVLHPRDVVHRPRHHRHVESDARDAAAGRPGRLGQPVLRLAAGPGLAAPDRRR